MAKRALITIESLAKRSLTAVNRTSPRKLLDLSRISLEKRIAGTYQWYLNSHDLQG